MQPSNIAGTNSPDFVMCGKIWETKSPAGKSQRTFEDDFRKAMRQSEHIIFDLRRKADSQVKWCIQKLRKQSATPKIKTLLVITRKELLILKGKFDIMGIR